MTTANDRESRMPRRAIMHQRTAHSPIFMSVTLLVVLMSGSLRNAWAWSTASTASTECSLPRHDNGRCGISPTRSRRSKCTISFSAMNENDYGEDAIDSPKQLKKAVNDLSRIPSRQSPDPNVAYSVPNLEDLVDPFETTDNTTRKAEEGIVRDHPEYPGRGTDDSDEDDADSDSDGWFLETDDYVNSRDHLNPDGSLNLNSNNAVDEEYRALTESLLRMQTPNVPASFLSEKEPTLESLLQQPPQDPRATSEVLHRKVFELEEGYLNQSEIFRESLSDSAASLEAARWRRGADYRRRQEEAISKLNKEIADFEAHLDENVGKNKVKCFKCGCALSPEEVEHTKSKQPSQRLCSLCYGDLLVAKSDRSFFRDESPPFRQTNQPAWKANDTRQSRNKTPNAVASNVPNKPQVSLEARVGREDKPVSNNGDDIEKLKQEVAALQDELLHLKEDNFIPDAGEATGPWSQVIDPDTGEVFYWNEETEEMKWEL